jgi:hypothetical protein
MKIMEVNRYYQGKDWNSDELKMEWSITYM